MIKSKGTKVDQIDEFDGRLLLYHDKEHSDGHPPSGVLVVDVNGKAGGGIYCVTRRQLLSEHGIRRSRIFCIRNPSAYNTFLRLTGGACNGMDTWYDVTQVAEFWIEK